MSDVKGFVFLGGTSTGYDWRKDLVGLLNVNYFNPVVKEWTEADAEKENKAKANARIEAYVITPQAEGDYSIAELTTASINKKDQCVALFLETDDDKWTAHQKASIKQTEKLLKENGAVVVHSLEEMAETINKAMGSSETINKSDRPE